LQTSDNYKNLIVFPEISEQEELLDYYYRVLWYLNPLVADVGKITFISAHTLEPLAPPPAYLDQSLGDYRDNFAGKIEILDPADKKTIQNRLFEADCILGLLPVKEVTEMIKQKYRLKLPSEPRIYFINHHRSRFAGSFWLKLAEEVFARNEDYLTLSIARFKQMAETIPGGPIYLLGTGPSLPQVMEMDLSGGTVFACNTMVKNKELMDKINPPVIVLGDPIFHAGCSVFAADLREHLCQCLDRYNSWLVVPLRDFHIYLENLPARFKDRVIALPFAEGRQIRYDFDSEFAVTTTSNILTLLLLPLAAYFSDDLRIGGCDGRPLTENDYFWKHDPSSQFTDKLKSLQAAHPAFFAISYDDYYLQHCAILEKWLSGIEAGGKKVTSITPSYIPALYKRYLHRDPVADPRVSIIMPLYNAEPFLEAAVESVRAQEVTDWELLVIDDGSTDGSRERVQNYTASDPRIRLLDNPKKGVSSARNHGLDEARGQYIAFLDADDLYYQKSLQGRLAVLEEDLSKMVSYTETEIIDNNGMLLNWTLGRKDTITFADMYGFPVHISSVMLRTAALADLRFDESLANGEDWLFFARLSARVGAFHRSSEGASGYRCHGGSVVKKDYYTHVKKLQEVVERIYYLKEEQTTAETASWPARDFILSLRKIELFTWSLLERKEQITELIKKEGSFKAVINDSKNRPKIWSLLINTVMRYYACHKDQVPFFLRRNGLVKYFASLGLQREFVLFDELIRKAEAGYGFNPGALTITGPCERVDQATLDETRVIASLFTNHLSGAVMIDVGAFRGSSFMPFLKNNWQVFAFEPDRENYRVLQERLAEKENAALVTLDSRAVSNQNTSRVSFYRSKESAGISSLNAFHRDHREAQKVDTVTLKEALREHDLAGVDFLKIDTEGHELFVLEGFPWERFAPKVIECEFEDAKTVPLGYTWEDLADYLYQKGYSVYVSEWHPVIMYGTRHDWHRLARFPCHLASEHSWGNLLAFRDLLDHHKLLAIVRNQLDTAPLFHQVVV